MSSIYYTIWGKASQKLWQVHILGCVASIADWYDSLCFILHSKNKELNYFWSYK